MPHWTRLVLVAYPILVLFCDLTLTLPAGAACRQVGIASAPFIGPADMTAIDRAVVSLPAIGTKQIELNVGSVMPRAMATKPVPPAVRKVLPQYVGYRAFRSGMTLVIVDPSTRRMSYLLPLRGTVSQSNCPN